jgi:hypothetical protein
LIFLIRKAGAKGAELFGPAEFIDGLPLGRLRDFRIFAGKGKLLREGNFGKPPNPAFFGGFFMGIYGKIKKVRGKRAFWGIILYIINRHVGIGIALA